LVNTPKGLVRLKTGGLAVPAYSKKYRRTVYIPLGSYKGSRKFNVASYGGLSFTFTVPRWLTRKIPKGAHVFVKTLPTTVFGAERVSGVGKGDLISAEATTLMLRRAMAESDNGGDIAGKYLDYEIDYIDKVFMETTEKLKTAFRDNLSRAMGLKISPARSIRRDLFTRLDSGRGYVNMLPGNDPYDENEFNRAIEGFHFERQNIGGKSQVRFIFKLPENVGTPHTDFGGGPSGFMGRDQTALSILGVHFKGGMRTPSQKNYMIVPTDGTVPVNVYNKKGNLIGVKQSMAIVTPSGKFEYPRVKRFAGVKSERTGLEKRQIAREDVGGGIPVNFVPGINAADVVINDPIRANNRVVFWGQVGKTLYLPKNVENILVESGIWRRGAI